MLKKLMISLLLLIGISQVALSDNISCNVEEEGHTVSYVFWDESLLKEQNSTKNGKVLDFVFCDNYKDGVSVCVYYIDQLDGRLDVHDVVVIPSKKGRTVKVNFKICTEDSEVSKE